MNSAQNDHSIENQNLAQTNPNLQPQTSAQTDTSPQTSSSSSNETNPSTADPEPEPSNTATSNENPPHVVNNQQNLENQQNQGNENRHPMKTCSKNNIIKTKKKLNMSVALSTAIPLEPMTVNQAMKDQKWRGAMSE